MEEKLITYLVYYFLFSPLLKIILLNGEYLLGGAKKEESFVRKVSSTWGLIDLAHAIVPVFIINPFHNTPITIRNFLLIGGNYSTEWNLNVYASLVFSTFVVALVGRFSVFYLHRDRYFHKFFTLYFVFQLALALIIFSTTLSYLFMGWELLGFSSVLLIGFYEHRIQPLKNSLRILFIYKVGDFLLFSFVIVMLYSHFEKIQDLDQALYLGHSWTFTLLLLACFIKSGLFPWHWLPRAMEGPTPSSAIFYGAVATHIPVFILLKCWPKDFPLSHPLCLIAIGALTFSAVVTSFLSRQASDAKNSLAYATMCQLSLIYIELLLGFRTLALAHCLTHGIYRAFEFLRAPSLLYLHHSMESARTRSASDHRKSSTGLLPETLRIKLYALILGEFGFLRRMIDLIDHYVGLVQLRFDGQALRRYLLWTLGTWIFVDLILIQTFPAPIDGKQEFFLFLAFSFNALAYANIYSLPLFLLSTLMSMELVMDLLTVERYSAFAHSLWAFVIFFALLFFSTTQKREDLPKYHNYRAQFRTSGWATNILFIIALSIVALPGLGNFFVWEFLVHEATAVDPGLVMRSFLLVSFNSLLVFVFFYVNFFGEPGKFSFVEALSDEEAEEDNTSTGAHQPKLQIGAAR